MFQELIAKMAREVEKLSYELNVTLPHEIRKAVELGDLKENSEYKAALERQQFVQARLGQLTQRVTKLANIEISQIAIDKVGLGSRVVVEDEVTKSRESYELVFGDAGELQEGHVTMASPSAVCRPCKLTFNRSAIASSRCELWLGCTTADSSKVSSTG